jgi:photosystem II stability/assembly factor-like uncharacterized protein
MQSLGGFSLYKAKFLTSSVGWVVGGTAGKRGLILKTTDGGGSWAVQDSSFAAVYLQSVSFVDPLHGWVVGSAFYPDTTGRILRTTNGGATWARVDSGQLAWPNDIFFVDSLRGYAVGQYGEIVRTTDGGVSWQEVYRAYWLTAFEPLRRVFFTARDSGWAVGGISGIETKVRTTDGGVTWQILNTTQGSSLHGLWFTDSRNGWTVGGTNAGLVIERTTDGGVTWVKQQHGFAPQDLSYFEAICMINPNEGWVVGDKGTILKTMSGGVTEVEDQGSVVPKRFELRQNYPNPFNPTTNIVFNIPQTEKITLTVCSMLGQKIATLVEGELPAGAHKVSWNGRDALGRQLPSGVYLFKLSGSQFSQAKKMVLLK